jgi:hypothetical protein
VQNRGSRAVDVVRVCTPRLGMTGVVVDKLHDNSGHKCDLESPTSPLKSNPPKIASQLAVGLDIVPASIAQRI